MVKEFFDEIFEGKKIPKPTVGSGDRRKGGHVDTSSSQRKKREKKKKIDCRGDLEQRFGP